MDFQSTQTSIGTARQNIRAQFETNIPAEMRECIENCMDCSEICEQLIQHCLGKGGIHAEARHIRILQDCVDICAVTAKFMIRESNLHHLTCQLCAEACLSCAQDCDRYSDDDIMKACVQMCRMCAESCEQMSLSH